MNILVDLHTHTIASGHAYSTMQEMIAAAKSKQLQLFGISDHAPAMPGSAYIYHFQNLRVVPKMVDGMHLMMGVEANIINHKGHIDMSMENLKDMDYVIASMHPPCIKPGTIKENTKATLGAMTHPRINIIGHPDDQRFALDYEALVLAAKENQVLLELNNASLNPQGFRKGAQEISKTILKYCEKYGVQIVLGSDAHVSYDVARFDYALALVEETGFPEELIANLDPDKLMKTLQKSKAQR